MTALIGFLLLGAAFSVHAQNYVTFGLGNSKFVGNGYWYNFAPIHRDYGFQWTATERSNTWRLGVGRAFSWGSLELALQDFGETNSFAGYPYDPGSPSLPNDCQYPCTPTQWVHHRGAAQGLSLSASPELKLGKAALFGRAGAALYRATFEYEIANEKGQPMASQFDATNRWSYIGLTHLYGFGARLGGVSLEYTRYPLIEAQHREYFTGSWKGIDTITLTYRAGL
jgi:hypothetical protein